MSPPAHAENIGLDGLGTVLLAVGAILITDVSFTLYDGVQAIRGKLPSFGYSVVETFFAAPQALVGGAFIAASGHEELPFGVAFAAWTSTLTAHGIWGWTVSRTPDSSSIGSPASTSGSHLGLQPMGAARALSSHPSSFNAGHVWGLGFGTSF